MAGQPKNAVGKISVECPHCDFKQLESAYAKSTLCRKCGQHFSLEKRPEPQVTAAEDNSLLKKVSGMFFAPKTRTLRCFSCKTKHTLSTSAKSTICSVCSTYIDLRDFKIATLFSRNIQTQGDVVITSKGEVTSSKISCGNAEIQGNIRGNIHCSDTATLKLKGKITGGIYAEHLVIEKNSNIEFLRPLKIGSAEIKGKMSARITSEGTVKICKSGCLEGTVYAKSIVVDKGGIFHGELFIGKQELSQPELIGNNDENLVADSDAEQSFAF